MKERRQKLRRDSPKAELILWRYLKGRKIGGYKFRRQYSVGGYVVDFYCPELRLVIEIDGPSHFDSDEIKQYDKQRKRFIESLDIRFIRFTNDEIYNNIEGVIEEIGKYQ